MKVSYRLVVISPERFMLVFRTIDKWIRGECQTVPMLFQILSSSTTGHPEILGNEVVPKEVFWEKLAATSGPTSYLATV